MSIWIAELDTAHFTFRAVGKSEADARRQMKNTWNEHRRQYSHANVAPFSDYEDAVNVWEATSKTRLRDFDTIGRTS
jgi:hypothetical protein